MSVLRQQAGETAHNTQPSSVPLGVTQPGDQGAAQLRGQSLDQGTAEPGSRQSRAWNKAEPATSPRGSPPRRCGMGPSLRGSPDSPCSERKRGHCTVPTPVPSTQGPTWPAAYRALHQAVVLPGSSFRRTAPPQPRCSLCCLLRRLGQATPSCSISLLAAAAASRDTHLSGSCINKLLD